MNDEQRIAFLMAQITACQCRLQGMVSANVQTSIIRQRHEPIRLPFQQSDFEALIEEFGLGHNSVQSFLQGNY